jgi:endonuclease-3
LEKERAVTVLKILERVLVLPQWNKPNPDPFETLVRTIISQNTTDQNAFRAFENLSKHFEITPEALAKAKLAQLEESIRVAGLHKNKASAILQISRRVNKTRCGNLAWILSKPFGAAREALLQFPGVGPKTADVVLLFAAKQPTIPVDTHVDRVAKRLGFALARGNYESVRESLQSLFNPSDYLKVHLLLIAHGRKYCKSRRPLCNECPINMHCPSKGSQDRC